ncbi:hypothetical protein JZ751_024677 [Albula glossodonta]|uniref:Uncharacterized protein n=1 Tax=Albula glossodonta TaxID=121402 RepID=A0A8T2PLV1_9TELE|nr:hypothetical protein JZ751_024677 [Albula glossodonta]
MEMAHLESDEEDMTVYEAKPLRRIGPTTVLGHEVGVGVFKNIAIRTERLCLSSAMMVQNSTADNQKHRYTETVMPDRSDWEESSASIEVKSSPGKGTQK